MPAAPSSLSQPPFPCPQGYAWDVERRRFYRLAAKLAKVDSREPAEASTSPSPHAATSLPEPDVPPSSYYSTPSQPPGAFKLASSPWLMPRDRPASMAASRQWRHMQVQRHVQSLRCHSRDNITSMRPDLDDEFANPRNMLSVSSFDRTGSLLTVPSVELSEEGTEEQKSQRKTLCLEQGNRSKGVQRWLVNSVNTNPYMSFLVDADRSFRSAPRQAQTPVASSAHFMAHCELEDAEDDRWQHGSTSFLRERGAVSVGFNMQSLHPRGLTVSRHKLSSLSMESSQDDATAHYREVNWQSAVVTQHPRVGQLFPDDKDALVSFICQTDEDRGDIQRITGLQITSASNSHSLLSRPTIRPLERTREPEDDLTFHVMAMNPDSGFCWVGQRDGSVYLLDTVEFCYQQFVNGQTSGSFQHIPLHGIKKKAVTNLLPVGKDEVVACFSTGAIALLRATPSDGTHIVRSFVGHVNEFRDMNLSACVDTDSRLLAVRGSDGLIRVWHLDSSFPLNIPSHESRRGPMDPSQPPQPPISRASRLRAESTPGHSAADAADQKRFETYDDLFYGVFDGEACKKAREIPLADLITRQTVKLHWGYPNWVGTRDAQWEVSREVNATDGLPRVERKGLLPSLMLMENSTDGPRIVWYEVVQSGLI